jgi:flagellar assembly protein FliH
LPSILKRFSEAVPYAFPDADQLTFDTEEIEQDAPPEQAPSNQTAEHNIDFSLAKKPIDYARLQAEAIMEDARLQASELVERAKVDMQGELAQLREDARQEGFRQGYAEGIANAMDEVREQRHVQSLELSREVAQFLEKASLAKEELLLETRDELRDLALAIAEKIVRISLKSSGDVVVRMIQGATEKMKRKEWVQIYIAGCDAKAVAQVAPGLTISLAHLSDHVRIVHMSDDESGTCIIEMPDEIIDASASTQLSNIRELLSDTGSR